MTLWNLFRGLLGHGGEENRENVPPPAEECSEEVAQLKGLVALLLRENRHLKKEPFPNSPLDDLLLEEDKALSLARLVRDYSKEAERMGAGAEDPRPRFARQMSIRLKELLLGGEGPQFALAGEGEYHEGSGWPLRELFVRLVLPLKTYPWSPHEIAQHRYEKNKVYENIPGFRVARVESVTHAQDLPDIFSVLLYERVHGPTFSHILLEIAQGMDSQEYTSLQKRNLLDIGRGLIRRSFEQFYRYLKQKPSHLPHTADEVRNGYIRALQRVPEVFGGMEISISEEEEQLWNRAVETIIADSIPFDNRFIISYRDTAQTNMILEPESDGLRKEYEKEFPSLTVQLVIAEFTDARGTIDYRLKNATDADPRVVNVDLGHRGAHVLDDFSHIVTSREVAPFLDRRAEQRYIQKYVGFLRTDYELNLREYCRSLDLAVAAMGFTRATRRLPNTFDFYDNLLYEHYERDRISSERFNNRREKFEDDIRHYLTESMKRASEVTEHALQDIKGDPQNIREIAGALLKSPLLYVNASNAAQCLEQLDGTKEGAVRLVLASLYARSVLQNLQGQFEQKGSRKVPEKYRGHDE